MTGKFWGQANHRPETSDMTDSTWERFKMIEFTQSFVGDKKIPEEEIKAQLRSEMAQASSTGHSPDSAAS